MSTNKHSSALEEISQCMTKPVPSRWAGVVAVAIGIGGLALGYYSKDKAAITLGYSHVVFGAYMLAEEKCR